MLINEANPSEGDMTPESDLDGNELGTKALLKASTFMNNYFDEDLQDSVVLQGRDSPQKVAVSE